MKSITAGKALLFFGLVAAGVFLAGAAVQAQTEFPTHPINLWVGLPPGGSADVLARALAEAAEKGLGQKIVVVNKAGGGGAVAASLLTKEKPDGYTLLLTTDTAITRAPHLSQLQYDPFNDFDHFLIVAQWKTVWTVKKDSPFKTWPDLVNWAKKNPGQLTFGHCSASSFYFGMVKIAKLEGFTFRSVPYACDGPTMTAVLGGHVQVGGGTAAPYRSHVLANNVRILLADEKVAYAAGHGPQTTFKDLKYNFEVPLLAIILAPKNMPAPVKKTLEKALTEALKSASLTKLAEDQEAVLLPVKGESYTDFLKKTSALYEELVKEAGLHKTQKKN
ncbi:MAG: tripartite tricarboxylate transporter substrate binding protein [Deltaproteobacteria bacterium]|nr:tripartite tricarboxylate transporter substrate binding protein [Deltaproteobacteria bacterium]